MTTTMQAYPDIDINIDADTMDLGSEAGNIYMDEGINLPGDSNISHSLDVDQDLELQDARSETAQAGEPDYFMADLDEINYSDEELVDVDGDAPDPEAVADEEITDVAVQEDITHVETEPVSLAKENSAVQPEEQPKSATIEAEPIDWDQDFIDYSDDEAPEEASHEPSVADKATTANHVETAEHSEGLADHNQIEATEQDNLHTTEQEYAESMDQVVEQTAERAYDDTFHQHIGVFDEQAYDGFGEQNFDNFAGHTYDKPAEEPYEDAGEDSYQDPDLLENGHTSEHPDTDGKFMEETAAHISKGTAEQDYEEAGDQDNEDPANHISGDNVEQDFEELTQETYGGPEEQPQDEYVGQGDEHSAHQDLNEFGEQDSEETLAHAPEEGNEDLNNFDEQAYDETAEFDQSIEHANDIADQHGLEEFETAHDPPTTYVEFEETHEPTDKHASHEVVHVDDEGEHGEEYEETAENGIDDTVDHLSTVEPGFSHLDDHGLSNTERPATDASVGAPEETVRALSTNSAEHESEHGHDAAAEAGWDEAPDESGNSVDQASSAEHEDSEHQSTVATGDAEDDYATESLHPVSVRYDGHEMMLFPLQTSATNHTYLLSDESVAHGTILDLFEACRECLGDTLGENIELRLELPGLRLEFSEDYISCNQISLSKILNIYKQLKAADGEQDPLPLEMILKKCENALLARLAWLEECADTNLGFLASQEQDDVPEQSAQPSNHHEESEEEYGEESNSNDGENQSDQHGSKRTFVEFEDEVDNVHEDTSSPKRVKTTE